MDVVQRLVAQLIRKGTPPHQAKRMAVKKLQKAGHIDSAGKLTPLGEHRSKMSPKDRAYSRAGRSPDDGSFYDPYDNKIKEM